MEEFISIHFDIMKMMATVFKDYTNMICENYIPKCLSTRVYCVFFKEIVHPSKICHDLLTHVVPNQYAIILFCAQQRNISEELQKAQNSLFKQPKCGSYYSYTTFQDSIR